MDETKADRPIKDASSVILVRRGGRPSVLMGQRGKSAVFMPEKFVFPGGAVEPADQLMALGHEASEASLRRLEKSSRPGLAKALQLAAIREVWEETGLRLSRKSAAKSEAPPDVPDIWRSFVADGSMPDASGMTFVFRAVTPPGQTRRFDARFFLADSSAIAGDMDDFSRASDELSRLQWIPIDKVRSFNIPFITEVVLADVMERIETATEDDSAPFFRHECGRSLYDRL